MKKYEVTMRVKDLNRVNSLIVWASTPQEAIKIANMGWRCNPELVIFEVKEVS